MSRSAGRAILVLCMLGGSGLPGRASAGECTQEFDGTFALIQGAIFERRGCTSATCHDASSSGGLNLTAGVSYDDLVDAPVQTIPPRPNLRRVSPAKKEDSLLWLNVAGPAPLRAMPLGFPPLTADELQVIALWIEAGAPRAGVVPGTGELLDACLPPPEPLETRPLDPPEPGTGLQFRAPRQILDPRTERERCFVTYYDVSDQVPEEFRGENGDTFRYKRIDARQDPLSHHAVVIPYHGRAAIDDPVWGEFRCGGGERDGELCEPTDLSSCGDGGVCGSTPKPAVGCIGFGPGGDASIGVGNDSLFNTMAAGLGAVPGVYAEAPLSGMLVWNSHAFNVTDEPGKLDIWVNVEFAPPEEQLYELERFTEVAEQFRLEVPAFEAQEICARYVVPQEAAVIELSSHNHKRGKRFRIWRGAWACAGGPNAGAACSPLPTDAEFGVEDRCAGTPCTAVKLPRVGDCNHDLRVSVGEIIQGVDIALGMAPMDGCPRFDYDGDDRVAIDELVAAVDAAIDTVRDPEGSLLYDSITYSDPAVARFDPPLRFGGPDSSDAERTLSYCGIYDNGVRDPSEVKRKSTSPRPTAGFPGGPCGTPVACTDGLIGAPCSGIGDDARDASCDSSPGAGDGVCDACPLRFGTTTEDEMFIILGAFFQDGRAVSALRGSGEGVSPSAQRCPRARRARGS